MPTTNMINVENLLLRASKSSSSSTSDPVTVLFWIIFIALIIWVVWYGCSKPAKDKAKKEAAFKAYVDALKQNLDHVKVLGTRTGTETITFGNTVMSTNGTVYSLLLVYKDKRKETAEVRQEDMSIFTPYIEG